MERILAFATNVGYCFSLIVAVISILCISTTVQRWIIFLHFANIPFIDLKKPSQSHESLIWRGSFPGISHARVIRTTRRNLLGWHLPASKSSGFHVLYFHGNGGNIGLDHRVELYE